MLCLLQIDASLGPCVSASETPGDLWILGKTRSEECRLTECNLLPGLIDISIFSSGQKDVREIVPVIPPFGTVCETLVPASVDVQIASQRYHGRRMSFQSGCRATQYPLRVHQSWSCWRASRLRILERVSHPDCFGLCKHS